MSEFSSAFRLPTAVELEVFLESHLKGQSRAVEAVIKHYKFFRSGLKDLSETDREKPIGVFFFLGPSGTGKTELGRLVAQAIYGTKDAASHFEMESFSEKHTVARFIGSPPGYIKCEEPAELSPEKLYRRIPNARNKRQEGRKNEQGGKTIFVSAEKFLEIKEKAQSVQINELSLWLYELDMADRALREQQIQLEELNARLADLDVQVEILKTKEANTGAEEKEIDNILERIETTEVYIGGLETRKKQLVFNYLISLQDYLREWANERRQSLREIRKQVKKIGLKENKNSPSQEVVSQMSQSPPVLILIFDEFEKAHPEIYNFFINMIGRGRITLANGDELDLRQAMIFFTSNEGSRLISEATTGQGKQIGFKRQNGSEFVDKIAKKVLKKKFSPEFLNRVDEIVAFENLSDETSLAILNLQLDNFSLGLQKLFIELRVDEEVKKFVMAQSKLQLEGQAHGLLSQLKRLIKIPISEMVEKSRFEKNQKIRVLLEDGKVAFSATSS